LLLYSLLISHFIELAKFPFADFANFCNYQNPHSYANLELNKKIISRYPCKASAQDTGKKEEKRRRRSRGPTGADRDKKWKLARCDEQRGRRGGKTCRHNVGSTTRQLSPASFIIKRPYPQPGIYLASPACASRGDDPVGVERCNLHEQTVCDELWPSALLFARGSCTSLIIITGTYMFSLSSQRGSFLIDRVLRYCDAMIGIGRVLWKWNSTERRNDYLRSKII